MTITLNSKERELAHPVNVATLLEQENLLGKGGVAVAVNGAVVRKPDWETRLLADGDDVLIISAAYGG